MHKNNVDKKTENIQDIDDKAHHNDEHKNEHNLLKHQIEKEAEIGSLLHEHKDSLKEIESTVTSRDITNTHSELLKKEILSATKDNIITREESQRLGEFIQQLGLQDHYNDIQEVINDGVDIHEFQQLQKIGYKKADFQRLITYYKERKKTSQVNQNINKQLDGNNLFQTSKMSGLLDNIDEISQTNTAALVSDDMQQKIAFFLQEKEKLEENKKKEFLQRLWEIIMMQYLEGKQLEIYEITVDENGNIIIKGKGGQQITIPAQDIKNLGKEFIHKKMSTIIDTKDLQKIMEKLDTAKDQENEKKDTESNQKIEQKKTESLLANIIKNN